jgi:hypothetical protein
MQKKEIWYSGGIENKQTLWGTAPHIEMEDVTMK